jgi:hypothetical protein
MKMKTKTNHKIDFEIIGSEMQCVEIELDPQESYRVCSRIEEGSILGGLGNLFDGDGR